MHYVCYVFMERGDDREDFFCHAAQAGGQFNREIEIEIEFSIEFC